MEDRKEKGGRKKNEWIDDVLEKKKNNLGTKKEDHTFAKVEKNSAEKKKRVVTYLSGCSFTLYLFAFALGAWRVAMN